VIDNSVLVGKVWVGIVSRHAIAVNNSTVEICVAAT
jgi:hypothetical protein